MLNPDGKIWFERVGEGMVYSGVDLSPENALRVIMLAASSVEKFCTEAHPSLAAVLPKGGERFQAVIPPASEQPFFVIRKKALQIFTLDDYVEKGTMSLAQCQVLKKAVIDRHNILVVGGTGTGKTTFANALLQEMSKTNHRILTIEDTKELQCSAENYVSLFVKEPEYTIKMAVKDALRLRPDRIIVGEVRDGSALDLLKAWNTGHNGGIATVHANSASEGLSRIEQLIGEAAANIPYQLIADAINIVVHIIRTPEGRKIEKIAKVQGLGSNGKYILVEY